ncbi:helix-turn-helix transcriptional regulator [Haloarcula litorea]|uniref:helix-turn-helix transcriptional regulator n=1 Tax=Haloarcula litorea TaxID=3032579 RepID=UPI0023E7B90E|nr:MarR family transcriptional regulator [Halomicroarcula sp. GDY20]
MDIDESALGDVQFLTGSAQRWHLLSALHESPARPRDLCESVDATRTTIQRILAGFREREWVRKEDGRYGLTVTGRRIHDRYRALLAEAERAREFGPLASNLGHVTEDLPTAALEDGELTVSTSGNPLAAVSRFTEWFRAAQGDVRAVSPIVAEPFNDIGAELLDDGTTIEFVIDASVLERSRSEYEDSFERGLDDDRIDIYVHPEPLSLGLVVDEGRCCLAAYDDGNNIRAVLESEDDAVYEWVRRLYERRRDRADPLTAVADGIR